MTDPSGAAISGATVQITNTDTGFKQSTKTGDTGLYRFTVLPLGTYEVEVQASGFGTTRRTGIALSAGATATVDIAVNVAGTTTMVDVTASAAITEPSRIDLGSTLSENMTRNLPLVSRNPYNFILFQPNVSGRANTEFGVPRKINANGFNGRINYQLDGSNNTESDRAGIRLIPISDIYVAEVQQVSNGFAPEFGNTVGTVFNTITKSGANDFHGEGAYLFRRTDFSARPKLLSSTALVPEVNVDSYSVDGGGRVIKDKLFFFGAFEHVKRDLPGVVTVSAANIAALGLPARLRRPDSVPPERLLLHGQGRLADQRQEPPVRALHAPRQRFAVQQQRHRRPQPGVAIVQLRGPLACGRGATGLDHQRPHRQRTARTGGVPRADTTIASRRRAPVR